MASSRGHSTPDGQSSEHERDDARQRQLRRLQTELGALREALQTVRAQTHTLWETETVRPLTGAETKQAGALSREAERLRWELRRLRNEFVLLQGSRDGRVGGQGARRRN